MKNLLNWLFAPTPQPAERPELADMMARTAAWVAEQQSAWKKL